MEHKRCNKGIFLGMLLLLGFLLVMPARPAMAAGKQLGDEFVIDLRGGTLKLPVNAETEAVYNTINAMNNNGVTSYDDSWDVDEFDLDKDGSKDLKITGSGGEIYTAVSGCSIKDKITLVINEQTLQALNDDGYDYYKKLTFRFPASIPIQISGASVSGLSDVEYTGAAQKPAIKVSLSDLVLQEGTHYKVEYSDNTKVGTATVKITGIGTCTGTITKTFLIKAKPKEETKVLPQPEPQPQPVTPAPVVNTVPAVKKGSVYTVSRRKYKVTNADMKGKGTVTLIGTTVKKSKLKKLTVPASVKIEGAQFKVTAIGSKAFKGFSKLKTITVKSSSIKSVGKNAIKGISKKAVIKVPKKKLKKYKKLFSSKTGFKKTMKIKK